MSVTIDPIALSEAIRNALKHDHSAGDPCIFTEIHDALRQCNEYPPFENYLVNSAIGSQTHSDMIATITMAVVMGIAIGLELTKISEKEETIQ